MHTHEWMVPDPPNGRLWVEKPHTFEMQRQDCPGLESDYRYLLRSSPTKYLRQSTWVIVRKAPLHPGRSNQERAEEDFALTQVECCSKPSTYYKCMVRMSPRLMIL